MLDKKESDTIRIDLTPKQKQQVRAATDRSVDAIEPTVSELEARIAPRLAANHNESILVG